MIRKNLQLLQLMDELAGKADSGSAISLRHYDVKQRLIQQDQDSVNVYVIKSGVAKCFITEENGKDYILEFLGEGEILGEIEAIRNLRSICTIEAVTPLSIYAMNKAQFLYFLRTMPDFSAILIELLATRVSDTSIKGARQQLFTLSEILPQLLSALADQHITFTKQDLAEYMGISVRSLNRLLKDAGEDGIA